VVEQSRFEGEMTIVGHEPIDEEKLKLLKPSKAMTHGGPGSGRYPRGSGTNSQRTEHTKMVRAEVMQQIVERESYYKKQPEEHYFMYAKDGTELIHIQGDATTVHIPAKVSADGVAKAKVIGDAIIVTHNHPSGQGVDTFSPKDYVYGQAWGVTELRVVSADTNTLHVIRTIGDKPLPKITPNQIGGTKCAIRIKMLKDLGDSIYEEKSTRPDGRIYWKPEHANKMWQDTWSNLAEKHGFTYEMEKLP
jgi:hypothetical protein